MSTTTYAASVAHKVRDAAEIPPVGALRNTDGSSKKCDTSLTLGG